MTGKLFPELTFSSKPPTKKEAKKAKEELAERVAAAMKEDK